MLARVRLLAGQHLVGDYRQGKLVAAPIHRLPLHLLRRHIVRRAHDRPGHRQVLRRHELAYGITSANPHFGAVTNPWNLKHSPGGSSGGCGAAVAAGLVYAALGTDTGGSIRIPASFCGTVGLKPTYGRVSRRGVMPLSWSLDHVGPLTSSVRDAALVLNAIAGHDPADASSSRRPVVDFVPDDDCT